MTFHVKFGIIDGSNMKKILFSVFAILLIISTQHLNKVVRADEEKKAIATVEAKQLDKQAEILALYLAKHDSPLQYHAQDFIDAAKKYNLDWRLVAAISGVESTFGKQIPGGYNGWGWGVYGNQAIFFNSWTEGIFTVSKGLRENYLDKGLTDPYAMNRIYAESKSWGSKVTYFMADLDKFAQNLESEKTDLPNVSSEPKIAAVSGQLVLR